ncbi:uncharacterized protein F5891DRAFT_973895 [Suillus fuscotomentosus]|uniref:Uncharacterized protein n=1 Tax=Suillus fuscotomentosus TaxID=1912939 RepID=A0AAD4ELQ0_9AGAM|nr:uncharacterized protein F5891DRAFT_973895 [Suillus fuscotomentosus]KAG1908499.1 hypothetical protein F5891DRAFT_973895 [Suillus fuscotomentosus]
MKKAQGLQGPRPALIRHAKINKESGEVISILLRFAHFSEPEVWVAGKLEKSISKAALPGNLGRFGSAPPLVMACGGLAGALKRWFADQATLIILGRRDAKARQTKKHLSARRRDIKNMAPLSTVHAEIQSNTLNTINSSHDEPSRGPIKLCYRLNDPLNCLISYPTMICWATPPRSPRFGIVLSVPNSDQMGRLDGGEDTRVTRTNIYIHRDDWEVHRQNHGNNVVWGNRV